MNRCIGALTLCLLFASVALGEGEPGQGQLVTKEGGLLPLKHTEVKAEVTGAVADVHVRQTFTNPYESPIEAIYVFPLPDRAAINDFHLEVGRYRIRGEIRRREEAREVYEKAKQAGKTAALLTQERPNIFTQHVANILPGGEIVVEIRYLEDLPLEKDTYSFVFPMVVGPRFIPPDGVPDADRIPSDPSEYLDTRPGNDIAVEVRLDAGVPFQLSSPSHRLDAAHDGGGFAMVRLDPADTIPNKDFVLEWRVAGDAPEVAVHVHRAEEGGFFTLMVQPEVEPAAEVVAGREMVFVLDCSGSMSGVPIETAKAVIERTLKTLRPDDTFQVLRFSEKASGLWNEPRPATPADVATALAYTRRLRGSGGTHMIEGIRAALSGPRDPERIRIVHFLTDGYIGNESQILCEIHRLCGNARIFPLGVGSSVNRYLIDRMAEAGRGAPAYIRQDASRERIQSEVDRFVERVRRPTLVDLEIDWGGLPVEDIVPAELPDLFVGRPVFVHGRFSAAAEGEVVLRGRRAGRPFEQRVSLVLPAREEANASLAPRWARAVIARLEGRRRTDDDPLLRELVTHIGLEFRLMTRQTAFVAVEETVVVENGEARTVRQPLPLPEGTQWDGFFGRRGDSAGVLYFASKRQAAAPSGPTTPARPHGGGGAYRGPSGGVPPGLREPHDPYAEDKSRLGKTGRLALALLDASVGDKKKETIERLLKSLRAAQGKGPSGLDQALTCLALLEVQPSDSELKRLRALQREDGGWSRVAKAASDPLSSALAVHALVRGGLADSDDALRRARKYFGSGLDLRGDETRTAAFAFGSLASGREAKNDPRLRQVLLRVKRNPLRLVDPMAALLRTAALQHSGYRGWKLAASAAGSSTVWTTREAQALARITQALARKGQGPFSIRS